MIQFTNGRHMGRPLHLTHFILQGRTHGSAPTILPVVYYYGRELIIATQIQCGIISISFLTLNSFPASQHTDLEIGASRGYAFGLKTSRTDNTDGIDERINCE